jgi:4a-hydroxytetrahydrobiopterin dehydratase
MGLGVGGNTLHTRSRRAFKWRTNSMTGYGALTWVPLKPEQNERQAMAELLRPEAVQVLLEEVPEWRLSDNRIERTLTFEGFPAAIEFVVRLARDAEEMNHHPDIDIRWNKVKLVLFTHSAGGLTDQDFLLARRIDKLKEQ